MVKTNSQSGINPVGAFRHKLDLFLRTHVFSQFEPGEISWVLSLSGGKDSYALAIGLRDWYEVNNFPFKAHLFTIDQWHGRAVQSICSQIPWDRVNVIDAYQVTADVTRYRPGDQAPCRSCANVRRTITDAVIADLQSPATGSRVTILARGLHLTDTAISVLWRFVMGINAAEDLARSGKARPIAGLGGSVYLAKPLYYIREYESQQFAKAVGYRAACCGCPACKYPSRRDIVEESVAHAFRGSLWEFEVPGMRTFLEQNASPLLVNEVIHNSAAGIEVKHPHLPLDFFDYAADVFRRQALRHIDFLKLFRVDSRYESLDTVGLSRLQHRAELQNTLHLPTPALFQHTTMSELQLRMVGTMGPFWGAIGLTPVLASKAWNLQKHVLGFPVDKNWSQVTALLRSYYLGFPSRRQDDLVQIAIPRSNDAAFVDFRSLP